MYWFCLINSFKIHKKIRVFLNLKLDEILSLRYANTAVAARALPLDKHPISLRRQAGFIHSSADPLEATLPSTSLMASQNL